MTNIKMFDQMSLPVSIDPKTKEFITANDIVDKKLEDITPLESLDEENIEKIILERINKGPERQLVVIGGKPMTKERATQEVLARSSVGQDIMEIQRRAIRMTLNDISR